MYDYFCLQNTDKKGEANIMKLQVENPLDGRTTSFLIPHLVKREKYVMVSTIMKRLPFERVSYGSIGVAVAMTTNDVPTVCSALSDTGHCKKAISALASYGLKNYVSGLCALVLTFCKSNWLCRRCQFSQKRFWPRYFEVALSRWCILRSRLQ